MNKLIESEIVKWVEKAPDSDRREFREAVHTVLYAIADSSDLRSRMILKGGILLAFHYQSSRYTTDIDFSTDEKPGTGVDENSIRELLNSSLIQVIEELDYGLDCRVQSSKLQPKIADASFPSIKLKIGYAYKGTPKHKRLQVLQSPTVVSIDYSLNEAIPNIEHIMLHNGEELLAYPLTDLIAEKYRAFLQQTIRNRYRRQDVFDLYFLIEQLSSEMAPKRNEILVSLISKAKARDLKPTIGSIDDPDLRARAEADYASLANEIEGPLPEFSVLFADVLRFYKSLPWK